MYIRGGCKWNSHSSPLPATRRSEVLVETRKKRQQLNARHLARKHSIEPIPIFDLLGRRNSVKRPFGTLEPPRIRNITSENIYVNRRTSGFHYTSNGYYCFQRITEGFLYLLRNSFIQLLRNSFSYLSICLFIYLFIYPLRNQVYSEIRYDETFYCL